MAAGFQKQRAPVRAVLSFFARFALRIVSRFEVIGEENFPESGPLLMVANHFSFIDPVSFVAIAPWPVEFVGGAAMPHAPALVRFIPRLWGYHPVYRGVASVGAMKAGEEILMRGDVLAIFPEAGNWATVLRPARPGAAHLATRTGAKLIPIGIYGLNDIFPSLARFKRARVTIRVGKPFGPFEAEGEGRDRRAQLDDIGHTIMAHIAELIPPEKRGHYSDDPAVREAAKGTERYPWDHTKEGEVRGQVN